MKIINKKFLTQWLVASRPISWINTAFPFVAGYLATGGTYNTYVAVAAFYFLVPYNFLVYVVNDVFDYESDKRNPRKNSIEGGLLPPETHRFMLVATVLINAFPLVYLFMTGQAAANLLLAIIVFGAVAYSLPPIRLKERPFLDSINSSFHFVGPLLFALLLTGWKELYWPYVLVFFLWGCASHAFGAVQDIVADRQANIDSIATFLGAKKTVRLALVLYSASVGLVLVTGWPGALVALPLAGYVAMVAPFGNLVDKDAAQANKGWRHFLLLNQCTGFVVTIIMLSKRVF